VPPLSLCKAIVPAQRNSARTRSRTPVLAPRDGFCR